jgi:hypothetical protein
LIYRWLYKLWKYFWITVGVLLGIALAAVLVGGIILQLPVTKDYLRGEVEKTFNEQFEGTLKIDALGGFIPLRTEVTGGRVFSPSDSTREVISFRKANVTINWWELLQQNLSISSFEVHNPIVSLFRDNEEIALIEALTQREGTVQVRLTDPDAPRIFNRLNIFAPYLSIIEGEIHTDETINLPEHLQQYQTLHVESLNTTLFLELTESQIFTDVLNFSADLPGTEMEFIQLTGQFYSDNRFFELNSISLNSALGDAQFSIEATPVNIYEGNLAAQFRDAEYRVEMRESRFKPGLISRFLPVWPSFGEDLMLEIAAEGTAEEFFIDRFQASMGQSAVILTAAGENLLSNDLSYRVQIENLVVYPDELEFFADLHQEGYDFDRYEISRIRGDIYGNLEEVNSDIRIESASGSLLFDSRITFAGIPEYEFLAEIDSLDLSPVFRDTVDTTLINGRIAGKGKGFDRDASLKASVDLSSSIITGFGFEKIIGEIDYDNRSLSYNLQVEDDTSALQAGGLYSNIDGYHHLVTDGSIANLNLPKYLDLLDTDFTSFTGTFSANIQGSNPDDFYGRVSMEMEPSIIGTDTLRAHQLYADIDDPSNSSRTLRFTSSFFDGELSGSLTPSLIRDMTVYWGTYLQERVRDEILFDDEFSFVAADSEIDTLDSDSQSDIASANLALNIFIKDLELLRKYLPALPELTSSARINASVNANRNQLLVSGNLFDDEFHAGNFGISGANSSISASFRYGEPLKEYTVLDFQVNGSSARYGEMNFTESYLNLSMRNDSLEVSQKLVRDDDISLESAYLGTISPGQFEIKVRDFNLGSSSYMWRTDGEAHLLYSDYHALTVNDLVLTSDDDRVEINGTFSSSFEDSVQYYIP